MAEPTSFPSDLPPNAIDQLLDASIEQHQAGQLEAAIAGYERVLAQRQDDLDALNLLGVAMEQLGRHAEAAGHFERALVLDATDAEIWRNLGRSRVGMGLGEPARLAYLEALRLDRDHVDAWRELGNLSQRARAFEESLEAWQQLRRLVPDDAVAANNQGLALRHLGRFEASIEPLRRATELDVNLVEAWQNLGRSLEALERFDEAEQVFAKLAHHVPDKHTSHLLHAIALDRLDKRDEALDAIRRAIALEPSDAEAHFMLGQLFAREHQHAAAAIAFAASAELRPDDPTAAMNQAAALFEAGSVGPALPLLLGLQERFPKRSDIRLYLSRVHERLGNRTEALEAAQSAVDLAPNDPLSLAMLGHLLASSGKQAAAEVHLRHALTQKPWLPMGAATLASMLIQRGELREGMALYRDILEKAGEDQSVVRSNYLLFLNSDPDARPEQVAAEHRAWDRFHAPVASVAPFPNDLNPERPLRIGYVSGDMRGHSVAYFMEPLLSAHSKIDVQVYVYDNTKTPDEITRHLIGLVPQWRRIVGKRDADVAELIRDDQIDILIDLGGHTGDNRLKLFALRPAPIQVSYLGYPNTTGLEAIQYRLTDALADPPGMTDTFYTERLMRLPRTFLCYKPPLNDLPQTPPPALHDGHGQITFGSFNTLSKLHPAVVKLWARVLQAVPNSRLLLKANGLGDPQTTARLTALFEQAGVSAERLIFAPRTLTYSDHMATYSRVDIALDSFPYNGTTTTCEALWMGVPVIALAGRTHVSRVGLSLLTNVGHPDWVATDEAEYIAIAARLASDVSELARTRAGLRTEMLGSPLMDGHSFARDMEAAYRKMWKAFVENASVGHSDVIASSDVPSAVPASRAAPGSLVVEGWRFLSHSYAVVNQMQCADLSSRAGITLYHEDVPLLTSAWQTRRGLLPDQIEQAVARLPPRPPGMRVQAAYRIQFPMVLRPHPAADRTFVFAAVEYPGQLPRLPVIDVELITPSEWSKQGLLAAGVPAEKVHVVPHGLDPVAFRPLSKTDRQAVRDRFKLSGYVFLNVGAMTGNKGLDVLLRSFRVVLDTEPTAVLLLKGNDGLYTSRQKFNQALEALPITDRAVVEPQIRYIGDVLSTQDMVALYNAADCYVTPYHAEGFNMPALEAVACGLPLIATSGGPTDSFGTDPFLLQIRSDLVPGAAGGGPGTVLRPDGSHLTQLMLAAMNDPHLAALARQAGPAYVQERFTWKHVVDRLLNLMKLDG